LQHVIGRKENCHRWWWPGGLTLARLLQLKEAEVKVYERDINRNVRVQGGALDLHTESGLAALEKAGLINEFKTHYRPGLNWYG
jgi:2-polyprenyl-6-methoxyphenol hydroxylase-like FAD-dependent oxidoreductase